MKELATRIINDYCETYGITPSDLVIKRVVKKKRNGIHYDWMRMSLAYLLRKDFRLTYVEIAKIFGYKDHTPVLWAVTVIGDHLKWGDDKIAPYWERLQEVYSGVMAA